MISSGNNRYY